MDSVSCNVWGRGIHLAAYNHVEDANQRRGLDESYVRMGMPVDVRRMVGRREGEHMTERALVRESDAWRQECEGKPGVEAMPVTRDYFSSMTRMGGADQALIPPPHKMPR